MGQSLWEAELKTQNQAILQTWTHAKAKVNATADVEMKLRKTFHALDLQHQIQYSSRCDAV